MAEFAALALISFFTFQKSLYEKLRKVAIGFSETLAGNSVVVESDIEPGAEVRLAFRGTRWTARNIGETTIAAGKRALVVEADGPSLLLAKWSKHPHRIGPLFQLGD